MSTRAHQQKTAPEPGSTPSFEAYGGSAAENYERYFVPAIGAPLAADLIEMAAPCAAERVLDVACGTGVVARLAAQSVGSSGTVMGLDINPVMLAVARSATPAGLAIEWHEANAEALPLPSGAYDAVLCQMGLQFFPDKLAALREMYRVLAPRGRVVVSMPGPIPDPFGIIAEALGRHVNPEAARFVHQVFSLHDTRQVHDLIRDAGFSEVTVRRSMRTLHLPAPAEFLWQYVHSTPLAAAMTQLDAEGRAGLERDVVAELGAFADDGGMTLGLGVVLAIALAEPGLVR
jgi:ubiquinone/menaquinone biosynthesis C-methylase UbiE